jgi:hypothetical protein
MSELTLGDLGLTSEQTSTLPAEHAQMLAATLMGIAGGHNRVALEHAVAAPFANRQLADLGARVIKVERAGSGDFARGYDETVRGMSSYFVWLNRGKESVALDIKLRPRRPGAAGRHAGSGRCVRAEPGPRSD